MSLPRNPTLGQRHTLELVVYVKRDRFTHPLPESGEVVIGRAPECDIRVDHRSVSRRHLRVIVNRDVEVEDLGSSNGTSLFRARADDIAHADDTHHSSFDRRIPASIPVPLHAGDMLRVGLVLVELRASRLTSSHEALRPGPEEDVIIRDPEMRRIRTVALKAAPSDMAVLLLGETGVGKEVMAELIHRNSNRAKHPLLRLNCAALSETLLEAELFGYDRGAFTGAHRDKVGLLESTNRGTVFLDEIGELPLQTQAKLLRVLDERSVRRVGGTRPRKIDVRFVSATNRDLQQDVNEGRFRQDLFFRIAGVRITIPPLRYRGEEVEPLARQFIEAFCIRTRLAPPILSAEALVALRQYSWPGNVRELKNAMERAALLCVDGVIRADHVPTDGSPVSTVTHSPREYTDTTDMIHMSVNHVTGEREITSIIGERERIIEALDACAGNQTRAAEMLGISRRTLIKRLDKFDLPRPKKGART